MNPEDSMIIPNEIGMNETSRKRTTGFKMKHEVEFGLKVMSRNPETGEVESVRCNFCVLYGKEVNNPNRKRKATENIKHFKYPFRVDNYRSHLRQHRTRWEEYQALSYDDKKAYFEFVDQPRHEKLNPYFEIRQRREIIYVIHANIVEELIGDLMFELEIDEERVPKNEALSIFQKSLDADLFGVSIENKQQYEACKNLTACGTSFRLTTRLLGSKGISLSKVTSYVRLAMALSFQGISDLLEASWAYSLSFIISNSMKMSSMDIRIRVYYQNDIHNFHLLTLPMFERHSMDVLFGIICRVLDVLDIYWKSKLVGMTTDGSTNFIGFHLATLSSLSAVVLPGFYGTWSGMHQLDVVIQNYINEFFGENLYNQLALLMGYLRQQEYLLKEFDTQTPNISDTHWSNLGKISSWILKRRTRIYEYLESKQPQCMPTKIFWIYIAVIDAVCREVTTCFQSGHGLTPTVSQQSKTLDKLQRTLMFLVDARHQLISLNTDPKANPSVVVKGEYFVNEMGSVNMIKDCGSFFGQMYDYLSEDEQFYVWHDVAQFVLGVIHGVSSIECNNDGNNSSDLPVVLPHQLAKLRSHEFLQILNQHRERFALFRTEALKHLVEEEHRDLRNAYRDEDAFRDILNTHDDQLSFKEAWEATNGRFQNLRQFCGGLATIYPHSVPLDLDVVMHQGKSFYKEQLTDSLLEGILHCKQLALLEKLKE